MAKETAVTKNLAENIARMEQLFADCDDIKKKQLKLGKDGDVPCYLTFIEVAVDMGNSALLELLKYLRSIPREELLRALEIGRAHV